MLITADALFAHGIGDYLLQSHWMAANKTKRWLPAAIHGICYTIPFIALTRSLPALLIIATSHAVIDRYRLAWWLVWLKNQLLQPEPMFIELDLATGYPPDAPVWLSTWLFIIADNLIHVGINGLALTHI